MLPRIESSEVISRFTAAIKEHNEKCAVKSHVRETASGKITVERKVGTVKEPITTTFHALLSAYVHNYNKICELLPVEFQDINKLPALRTNSIKVGKYAHCSDRTVRNHLTCLRKLNMVETKFHGRKQDYELWINTDFLFGKPTPEIALNAPKTALEESKRKNFPPNYTHLELKNKQETNDKDMLIKNQHGVQLHGEEFHGEAGKTDNLPDEASTGLFSSIEENVAPAPWITKAQKVAENDEKRKAKGNKVLAESIARHEARKPKLPGGIEGSHAMMLAEFWIYAMRVIYPQRNFSKEQQEKALIAITDGVYENFQDAKTDREWASFQVYQMEKLDKVAQYLHRNPDKYAALPFSLFGKGKGYFDLGNKNGFAAVDKWMDADKIKKICRKKADLAARKAKMEAAQAAAEYKRVKEEYCEKLMRTARMDFEKQARMIAPRVEVAHLTTRISLYYFWHTRFGGQGGQWQEKFHNQYLEMEARNFMPPKYRKERMKRILSGENSQATEVYVQDWMHDGEGYYSLL